MYARYEYHSKIQPASLREINTQDLRILANDLESSVRRDQTLFPTNCFSHDIFRLFFFMLFYIKYYYFSLHLFLHSLLRTLSSSNFHYILLMQKERFLPYFTSFNSVHPCRSIKQSQRTPLPIPLSLTEYSEITPIRETPASQSVSQSARKTKSKYSLRARKSLYS